MINIYEYFDYRKLLKSLFDEEKEQNRYFSYRVLGELVGFTSAGFFTKILQGTVNISSKNALSFAKAFRLSKLETRYFELLVMFNQAKSHEERRYYFEQIIAMRRTKIKTLTPDQYDLFSEWFYVAIREVLDFYPFYGNYRELGNMLVPQIAPNDVKRAIDALERLNLIRLHPDGYYERTDEAISTGEEWESVAITNFQLASADLAKDAMQHLPKELREISTLTMSISESTFNHVTEKLRSYRREILEIARKDQDADRIYHLNVHFFPLSKPYERTNRPSKSIVTPIKKSGKRGRPRKTE